VVFSSISLTQVVFYVKNSRQAARPPSSQQLLRGTTGYNSRMPGRGFAMQMKCLVLQTRSHIGEMFEVMVIADAHAANGVADTEILR
jgi:hypothetical protein